MENKLQINKKCQSEQESADVLAKLKRKYKVRKYLKSIFLCHFREEKAEWPREERTFYLFIVNMTLKWHEKCHSAPLRLFYFDCLIALLQCNFYYYMDRDELQHRPIGSDNVPSLPSFFITKCIRQGKKKTSWEHWRSSSISQEWMRGPVARNNEYAIFDQFIVCNTLPVAML